MLSLHFLHFAFNKIQEITGILSYQEIMLSHFGQIDLDLKKDTPDTSLKPTTFRNEPQHKPNKKIIKRTVITKFPFCI